MLRNGEGGEPSVEQLPIRVGVGAAIVRDGAILLVEVDDPDDPYGPNFNLPGGGVEPGESLHEALRREVREETSAEITVGRLLLLWQYLPGRSADGTLAVRFGATPKLTAVFAADLLPGSEPRLPDAPDPNEVAVRWLPLAELPEAPLLPSIATSILGILGAPADGHQRCPVITV